MSSLVVWGEKCEAVLYMTYTIKNSVWAIFLIVLLCVAAALFFRGRNTEKETPLVSYKNSTYVIEGQSVSLVDGVAVTEIAPGSASKLTTRYFGNEAHGDLNGDGTDDVVFLLTQDGGGSGTFYYAVAALSLSTGFVGTNAVLLGDRIAPQTTEIANGSATVNYADRKDGESMTTSPSVGVSKRLRVTGMTLSVIE